MISLPTDKWPNIDSYKIEKNAPIILKSKKYSSYFIMETTTYEKLSLDVVIDSNDSLIRVYDMSYASNSCDHTIYCKLQSNTLYSITAILYLMGKP